jgi:membrane protease YdiL (CAAX protease family)
MSTPTVPAPSWGFSATLAWGAGALLAPFAIVAFFYQVFLHGDPALDVAMSMLAQLGSILVVAAAARIRGWNIGDYLSLTVPRGRDMLLGLVSAIIFLATEFLLMTSTGRWIRSFSPPDVELAFLLSALLVTPFSEELVYRGFLYRGLAKSVIGPWGALLVIAVIFAVLHGGAYIIHFLSGALLGWLRLKTNSTSPAILAHATLNLGRIIAHLQGF